MGGGDGGGGGGGLGGGGDTWFTMVGGRGCHVALHARASHSSLLQQFYALAPTPATWLDSNKGMNYV